MLYKNSSKYINHNCLLITISIFYKFLAASIRALSLKVKYSIVNRGDSSSNLEELGLGEKVPLTLSKYLRYYMTTMNKFDFFKG